MSKLSKFARVSPRPRLAALCIAGSLASFSLSAASPPARHPGSAPAEAKTDPSSATPEHPLIDAIRDRDRTRIQELLAAHADVNAPLPDGSTPLAWAVYLDEADVVSLLLKGGAKIQTADQYGETPLTLACATGDFPVIKELVSGGADVNAARWNGETALMIASRTGSAPAVQLLLDHGAHVDAAESRKGQNALMWAAAEGHADVIALLLKSGANVKAVSSGGFTPLVFAARKGDAASVRELLDAGLSPDYTVPGQTNVLHVAVEAKSPDAVHALIEHHVTVDSRDPAGNTALQIAAKAGSLEIVKLLLAGGADPNLKTASVDMTAVKAKSFRFPIGEQTALMLAARANHEDVMRALVAGGADPKLKAQDGTTLLMSAAGSGRLPIVTYAYELDPDVNAITMRKWNAVHAAVFGTLSISSQPEICDVIKFLASKGADIDSEDVNGRTPMVIANLFPIDQAVILMNKLLADSGKAPKKPVTR